MTSFLSLHRRHLPSLFPTDTSVITIANISPKMPLPFRRQHEPALLTVSPIPPSSFRLVVEYPTTYASIRFFLILRPASCDFRALCQVSTLSVGGWDAGRMLVCEEQRGGVPTWLVLSLVALVDPDASNSDDDLHQGRPVKHEMTYLTPLAYFDIHAAGSRVIRWRRYSCTVSSLVRRGQHHREPNSEE